MISLKSYSIIQATQQQYTFKSLMDFSDIETEFILWLSTWIYQGD